MLSYWHSCWLVVIALLLTHYACASSADDARKFIQMLHLKNGMRDTDTTVFLPTSLSSSSSSSSSSSASSSSPLSASLSQEELWIPSEQQDNNWADYPSDSEPEMDADDNEDDEDDDDRVVQELNENEAGPFVVDDDGGAVVELVAGGGEEGTQHQREASSEAEALERSGSRHRMAPVLTKVYHSTGRRMVAPGLARTLHLQAEEKRGGPPRGFLASRGKRFDRTQLLAALYREMARRAAIMRARKSVDGKRGGPPRGFLGSRGKRFIPGLESLILAKYYQDEADASKWKRQPHKGFHGSRG